MPQSFGTQLAAKGWQAGAVIPRAMLPALAPHMARPAGHAAPEIAAADWLVVVSQTCDVLQAKLENEPLIELLHCKAVDQLRPEFQGRKSTRQLDFKPNKDRHEGIILSAHAIADRYVVPRGLFTDHQPDPDRSLGATAVTNLQQWYALRYTRPAWPDTFVARLAKAQKKLTNAIKQLTVDDVEVRVAIREKDEELAADKDYHLAVFFIVDQTLWDTRPDIRETAYKAFDEFVAVLNGCKGVAVDLDLSAVRSGEAFSWQMTRTTDEWNFANLSQ